MKKTFVTADQLQHDSFRLAQTIINSGFRPTFLVGLWRGGSPIAITVHEVLEYCGIPTDHISIKVSSYKGIDQRTPEIKIHNLDYIKNNLGADDHVLIVDDVHDTGLSMAKLVDEITRTNKPQQTKIAVAYYKPKKSLVDFAPDFFIHKTNDWLVFPHELCGLNDHEIDDQKPDIQEIKSWLLSRSK